MSCKFSNINFGDVVKLGGGSTCCGVCGADIQSKIERMYWKYVGHSDNVDLFEAVTKEICPSCGSSIDGYAEVCGGLGVTEEIESLNCLTRKLKSI